MSNSPLFQEYIIYSIPLLLTKLPILLNFIFNIYSHHVSTLANLLTIGAILYGLIEWWPHQKYKYQENLLKSDLASSKKIQTQLSKYIYDHPKDNINEISIRLIHIKNYPWELSSLNDGFKQYLDIRINKNKSYNTWSDHNGIWIIISLLREESIYINENNEFIIDKPNKKHPNFKEYSNKILNGQIPFKNIVEVDFENKIEYEPIFYTKYAYNDYKNLYNPTLVIRNKPGDEFFHHEININNRLYPINQKLYRN